MYQSEMHCDFNLKLNFRKVCRDDNDPYAILWKEKKACLNYIVPKL
jgi:hypothetical protein